MEVYNGSGVQGVARRTQIYLRTMGYDVLKIGTASDHFDNTIVVERLSPNNANAQMLARTLKLKNRFVTRSIDSTLAVSVTLFIGEDYENFLPDSVETIQ
ncbi:LytR C-terminal domain-containing protein [candidate division WOR-3 bacterium]|nr:LytR C-terminal domain-containing protein [candidate division WOR-3 bacterium]